MPLTDGLTTNERTPPVSYCGVQPVHGRYACQYTRPPAISGEPAVSKVSSFAVQVPSGASDAPASLPYGLVARRPSVPRSGLSENRTP